MEWKVCFLVNYLSDNFNNLTLKYLVIIDKSFDQKFKLSSLLLINNGREDIMDEVLKARFIKF